ncbi:MAG: adenosylcobalamin-dependent ribonucleoside-diphosphate reductase [Hyphomicrobiaceae bacterium]
MSSATDTLPAISRRIWDLKYRLRSPEGEPLEATLEDTWARVATAAAQPEKKCGSQRWAETFRVAMSDLAFLPAGRIIAGAGSGRDVTLFNCFVMGAIDDDLSAIFENVREAALTMQRGGGIGHDFSTLRPEGALVHSIGAGASGPVSFMDVWDAMCRTIMSAGQRRGAMMATLRCDHPDIEAFVDAKADAARLRNFNLSVLVTDAFRAAVEADADWPLVFAGTVFRTVRARALWERIMRATYDYAEPGVIFIDRINAQNNLAYCEEIRATNPCGEQPLPPYGACLLGSINLARLVVAPFTVEARLDETRLAALVPTAVRCLDNIIDVSAYPLPAQQREAKAKRRIGLGITGLADALIMCGVGYGTPEGRALAQRWMQQIEAAAYLASAELAAEKGPFPLYDVDRFLAAPNVARLPAEVRDAIRRHGIRNGCLTSIAPTGTISLLAGNVSSGIEPVFDFRYSRRIRGQGSAVETEVVEDYAHRLFRQNRGEAAPLPPAFVTAGMLTPRQHLEMQAALQPHVDSSISKTINCPEQMPFEAFKEIYAEADRLGLKGCTTFRPNPVTGSVLTQTESTATDSKRPEGTATLPTASPAPSSAVATPLASAPATTAGRGVVYMSRPLERDPALAGYTYKLKWAASDHALYITINDIEHDGRRRPFEIFINTRHLEHYAWTVALTRMISAVFRRGGDVTFVVDELKAIFDPQGGQWMDGRYVPSLLAAIGEVIEQHMLRIGFLSPRSGDARRDGSEALAAADRAAGPFTGAPAPSQGPMSPGLPGVSGPGAVVKTGVTHTAAKRCPRCGHGALVLEGGCWVCLDCGHTRCG